MSVAEILEQVKSLSQIERDELLVELQQMQDFASADQPERAEPEEHWGKALNRLMDEIGPIEMLYPEIEDPVEWVKHLRAEERRRRFGDLADWGEYS
jgi:hypothetical protein